MRKETGGIHTQRNSKNVGCGRDCQRLWMESRRRLYTEVLPTTSSTHSHFPFLLSRVMCFLHQAMVWCKAPLPPGVRHSDLSGVLQSGWRCSKVASLMVHLPLIPASGTPTALFIRC
eukprot:262296-Amphidinium_carterae.1